MDNANIKIEDAGFATRALNSLSYSYYGTREFETLGDIQKSSRAAILRLPGCGLRMLNHIMEVLDDLGLATDNLQPIIRKPKPLKPPNPDGLKTCPFCYSAAKYLRSSPLSGYRERHWVKCTNDGNSEEEGCEVKTAYWTTREGAIFAWNRRKKRVGIVSE